MKKKPEQSAHWWYLPEPDGEGWRVNCHNGLCQNIYTGETTRFDRLIKILYWHRIDFWEYLVRIALEHNRSNGRDQ